MVEFKCKMCGGSLKNDTGETIGICEYCGSKQTLPKTTNDNISNLFNRANNLRLKCEFDKAMSIYEKIVEQDDSEAEAHWGIVLCRYGIEYVEDPTTKTRIPTCHRTLYDAVTKDVDYQAAIDYSDTLQQTIYEKEARAIDKIQKDILAIVQKEEPFDVFICYKETDEDGNRTKDSVLANDIYHQLAQEGFKVFYAPITLEDKLGEEYEPYIFAALSTAKVMLAVGSKPEYFNAVWVKNEWSRFLNFMKIDRAKLLIPCYRDMDAYDLPEEFSHLQAQDMGKIGFINDVIRGIKKVIEKKAEKSIDESKDVKDSNVAKADVMPLLKRAFMALEDGEWERANDFCEQVLNQNPENAEAYLGKLMAELKVNKRVFIADCEETFENNNNYLKAIRFGDDKLVDELKEYIDVIKERNENIRKEEIFDKAIASMNSLNHKQAAELFASIKGFRNSDELAEKCLEKVNLRIYDNAVRIMHTAKNEKAYHDAEALFTTISGFKNSDILCEECKKQAELLRMEQIYNNGMREMDKGRENQDSSNYRAAIKILSEIPSYKDVMHKIEECNKKIDGIMKNKDMQRHEWINKNIHGQETISNKKTAKKDEKKIYAIAFFVIISVIILFTVLALIFR